MVKAKSIEHQAKEIEAEAEETLHDVDRTYVFTQQERREFPTFDKDELTLGRLLGKGGFSNVFEVKSIKLKDGDNPEEASSKNPQGRPKLAFVKKEEGDEDHYDVNTARHLMSTRCVRFGAARYAVKKLRFDLNKLEEARGALDLALEIKFLSVLSHPNIIKMRAFSNTPTWSLDTFIVMGENR